MYESVYEQRQRQRRRQRHQDEAVRSRQSRFCLRLQLGQGIAALQTPCLVSFFWGGLKVRVLGVQELQGSLHKDPGLLKGFCLHGLYLHTRSHHHEDNVFPNIFCFIFSK